MHLHQRWRKADNSAGWFRFRFITTHLTVSCQYKEAILIHCPGQLILSLGCLFYIYLLPQSFTALLPPQCQHKTLFRTSLRSRNNFAPLPQQTLCSCNHSLTGLSLSTTSFWSSFKHAITSPIFSKFLLTIYPLKQPLHFSVLLYHKHLERVYPFLLLALVFVYYFSLGTLESSLCIFILHLSVSRYCRFFHPNGLHPPLPFCFPAIS